MTDFEALRAAVIKGKRNDVAAIVQAAIDGGEDINLILDRGMIPAMWRSATSSPATRLMCRNC